RYLNGVRTVSSIPVHTQPRRRADYGRRVLPDDAALWGAGVRLRAAVLHLQPRLAERGRGLLQRQTKHAWYDIVSVQDGGGKENEVRRQIPYHDGSDEGESPTSRPGQVAEGGQLPFLQRRDVTAELHQRVRAKRAAYAPSIPSRCGRDCRSPSGVSRAAGTAAGTGARPNSGWQARN